MKGPVQSRPSKASLVARGLAAKPAKGKRNIKSKKVPDAKPGYSLYSTDSEDQAFSVGRGLDRCAALLTNILDSDTKDPKKKKAAETKKVVNTRGRSAPTPAARKPVPTCTKSKVEHAVRSKAIVVPTASHQDQGPTTLYNERLVASTPLLNSEERKRQHDLLEREQQLTHQIQQLRQHFELLQRQQSPEIQDEQRRGLQDSMLQELDEYQKRDSPNQSFSKNSASRHSIAAGDELPSSHASQGTPSARRSLDFNHSCHSHETNEYEIGKESPMEVQQTSLKTKGDSLTRPKKQVRVVSPDSDEQYKPRSRSPTRNVSKHVVPSEEHLSVPSKSRMSCSPVAAESQVRTLQYLTRELREVIGRSDDLEVNRLLMEIDQTCSLLPYMCTPGTNSSSTGRDHPDLHQLKLENAQLRRNLRIAEGKSQEQERMVQSYEDLQRGQSSLSFELAACRSENASLQKRLQEEKESKDKLKKEIENFEKIVSDLKEDKKQFIHILENKEQNHSKTRRSGQQEMLRLSNEIKRLKAEVESGKISLEAAKKEGVILNLSLKQKETEIERLNELTRSQQQSMQRVLGDIPTCQPNSLSKDGLLSRIDLAYNKHSAADLGHLRPIFSSTRSRDYQPPTVPTTTKSRDNNTNATPLEHRPTSLDLDAPIFNDHPLVSRQSYAGLQNKSPPTHHERNANQTLEMSPDGPVYFSPKASLGPGAWTAEDSMYLSPEYKNKSAELSSLSSRDEEEFQRDLQSLDAEIARIQRSLRETAKRTSNN